jgi:cyclic pyranopterin phosphate synthase
VSGQLSHIGDDGAARMVDVSAKPVSVRTAEASGMIRLGVETLALIASDGIAKGNVLATARIAGIQAAKKTAELIPLCHPLPLSAIEIHFEAQDEGIAIRCRVKTTAQTGVEMEALTGVSVAALTIYDMCKAVDRDMAICDVRLLSKTKK